MTRMMRHQAGGMVLANQAGLTPDDLRALPALWATERYAPTTRARFQPISTMQVVEALTQAGYIPVRAMQARTKDAERLGFTRHLVVFRFGDSLLDGIASELLVLNANDGGSSYRFIGGLFRSVCENGLIVADQQLADLSIQHRGVGIQDRILTASSSIAATLPLVLRKVDDWMQIALSPVEQLAYAAAALRMRYPDPLHPAPIGPAALLTVRRAADGQDDLWTVFNRVQEHLIRGGLPGQSVTGRKVFTRPLAGVDSNVRMNTALWALTAQFADRGGR